MDGVKPEMIKEYMEQLWDEIVECRIVEGPRELITEMEVEKAGDLTELVGEIIHGAGEVGVKKMTEICNMVVDNEKIPMDWELSTLLPIYKGKGDPLECGANRAMKVFERVLERRLRWNAVWIYARKGDNRCRISFW